MDKELVAKYRRLVDVDYANAGVGPVDDAELRRRLQVIGTEEGLKRQIAILEAAYPAPMD